MSKLNALTEKDLTIGTGFVRSCGVGFRSIGFPRRSFSDSIFCWLRWCPGLLGVSASRLLCFFPRVVATLLWCLPHFSSFLHRASAFCHSSKMNLPNPALLSTKTLWPTASLPFLFQVPNYSPDFLILPHTALLTLKLAKPMIWKKGNQSDL